jgi:serine/threonine-protein kinase HipA
MSMLKMTYPEAEQMFRRMVFNIKATNYDDHTKNFSFRVKKDYKWELSPAYDICYSYDPDNIWVSQHKLSINEKHKNINKSELMKIAANIKKGEKIIEDIKTVLCNWETYSAKAKVSPELSNSISKTLVTPKF